jgi:hypothetical protein
VGKIRRGGYVFINWKGDHEPLHVHVFKDGVEVLKWDLVNDVPMSGRPTAKILKLIRELVSEGRL